MVDNPPFSIISQIAKWYADRDVKFFMFCQGTTAFSSAYQSGCCVICTGTKITYDNGVRVDTSFLTNLEPGVQAMSAPDLYDKIMTANSAGKRRSAPKSKHKYPANVITSTILEKLSNSGISFQIRKRDSCFVRALDAQRKFGKAIYGAGFLISDKAAAEKAISEKEEAVLQWELNDREREIIRSLDDE